MFFSSSISNNPATQRWNPWHGCFRYSEGCANCFIFSMDSAHGCDTHQVSLNKSFDLPLKRAKNGDYKIKDGTIVYTCMSSDFLLKEADIWRQKAWEIMRIRRDLHFVFFTKRINRLAKVLPSDWGNGYDNVSIGCSVENQKRADERLPFLLSLPIKHRWIVCAPLLGEIHIESYLNGVELVSVGGESGYKSRICRYEWILSLRDQAQKAGVSFHFHQTGARFQKEGKLYQIPKKLQTTQAKKANIDI